MTAKSGDRPVPVSVLVFTLNEEIHLPLCLDSLSWCEDVVVVDSLSTDGTERIAQEYGVRFVQRSFDGFGSQRNWALQTLELKHEWVLILDADERVPTPLVAELGNVCTRTPEGVAAYCVRRRFHMWGRWLRHSSLYPTWVVRLVRRGRVRYVNRGHAETQDIEGEIGALSHDLIDENLKGIDEWFDRHNRYARQQAEYELERDVQNGIAVLWQAGDPLRRQAALKAFIARLPFRPLWYFLYAYVWRGGFLDGRPGLVFCLMRATYEHMIVLKKADARLRRHRAAIHR